MEEMQPILEMLLSAAAAVVAVDHPQVLSQFKEEQELLRGRLIMEEMEATLIITFLQGMEWDLAAAAALALVYLLPPEEMADRWAAAAAVAIIINAPMEGMEDLVVEAAAAELNKLALEEMVVLAV